ncbi:MAG: peptidoglycan-binding protein [Hassallia sp. WJT32-NPBG1]|jgi:peptidoglycan hydrolase-like protein with peptidoglycan-binding domain|nr:peptidoglycan-binding protein [Hassallia sp. WJT32-NPBG1]
MWCGFGKSSIPVAVVCLITASVVISDTVSAARQRNYSPQQFRAVLRGLGYSVDLTNTPLTDAKTKKAIREFQTGYKLTPADGIAGPKTQDFAANIIQILQANLNAVLKPKNPLPRDQFYGSRTEAAVKEAQKRFQLQETGIADLAFRQRLNEEAKTTGGQPSTQPSPAPTSSPTPTATPTTTPTTRPTTTPTATPTTTPTTRPTTTPTTRPRTRTTPTPTPTSSPEVTPTSSPQVTPTSSPRVTPTPTVSPTP